MTDRKAPRSPHALFAIEGDCQRPQGFGPLDLSEAHPNYRVDDLATVDQRLSGKGVRLRTLIDTVGPGYGVAWITIESLNGFRACLPLAQVSRTGIVVYEKGGKPLSIEDGGPARLIVPYLPGEAADVKALSRLVLTRDCIPTGSGAGLGSTAAARR